jgi:hypothetical protein
MTRAHKLLYLNIAILISSLLLWVAAWLFDWLESVTFVSHVSMLALVFTAIGGIAAGDAAVEASPNES